MDLAHDFPHLREQAAAIDEEARRQRIDEEARRQRAGSIGELGLSIAHEINQPLAAIALHAAAAHKWLHRGEPDIERAIASLTQILDAGRQAGDIVRSVQRLAAREEDRFGEVAVDDAIADGLRWPRRLMRRHGIALDVALALDGCTIHASRIQLQQVLTNLLLNAIEALAGVEAAPGGRRIRVASRRYNAWDIEIEVADNGPGISPADRERVFGRLYSTKRNGTGLGLTISRDIARAHGGELGVEPCEPHGARFRLRLPARVN